MAVLIDVEDDEDLSMCSECGAIFELQHKPSPGVKLSFCPFCGEELEDETDD